MFKGIIDIICFHISRGKVALYNYTHKQEVETLPEAVEASPEEAEAFFKSYNHQWEM